MARRVRSAQNAPVRMGMLNILMQVIALCLAVLAVLALSTARAGAALSERQAANVRETYAVEAAGQAFVAEVDAHVAALREGGIPADRFLAALERSSASRDDAGITRDVRALSPAELDEALGRPVADAGTLGALEATFTGPTGHAFTCVLAVEDDGTCTTLQWTSTRLWQDEAPAEQLLRTDA